MNNLNSQSDSTPLSHMYFPVLLYIKYSLLTGLIYSFPSDLQMYLVYPSVLQQHSWSLTLIWCLVKVTFGEGNGTPLQYSCLENPMGRGAWWAAVHGVAKSWTQLSNFPFTFSFMHWRRKWQPTLVFLPGESQGWGSLVGCCLWGRTESDTTEATQQQQQLT